MSAQAANLLSVKAPRVNPKSSLDRKHTCRQEGISSLGLKGALCLLSLLLTRVYALLLRLRLGLERTCL